MKRVLVKSVYDAFEYVLTHFYPFGMEDMVTQNDSYVVISVQDSHTGGFGFQFTETKFCKGVLTLYFDDNIKEIDGAVMFSDEHANQIIDFIQKYKDTVDTLMVHCYGGQSRSRAVGAFAVKMLGGDNSEYFETGIPNQHVYDVLEAVWIQRMLCGNER